MRCVSMNTLRCTAGAQYTGGPLAPGAGSALCPVRGSSVAKGSVAWSCWTSFKTGVPGSMGDLRKCKGEVSWSKGTSGATSSQEGITQLTVPRIKARSQVLTPLQGYVTSLQGGSEWRRAVLLCQVELFLAAGNRQPDGREGGLNKCRLVHFTQREGGGWWPPGRHLW